MPDHRDRRKQALVDPRVLDPDQVLVQRGGVSDRDMDEIVEVLAAMQRYREAEDRLNHLSRAYMKLNQTDMAAMRFLIAAKNRGELVTAKALATQLGISTASTTKLLDRMVAAGHLVRMAHPTDRRALVIAISEDTHQEVMRTVGWRHARRFEAVARLSSADRRTVIRFLDELCAIAPDGFSFEGELEG